MSHVYCPECGFQSPAAVNYCARCGALLSHDTGGETTMSLGPDDVREEDDISLRRRFLHGQIEILRATRYARSRHGTVEVSDLARVLTTRARPKDDGQA